MKEEDTHYENYDEGITDEDYEYFVVTDCICDHDHLQHGYGGCLEDNCPCPASWEE